MNEMERNTLNFCIGFIHEYIDVSSQNGQCRTWLKKAISLIKAEALDAEPMILSELDAVDDYLSGKETNATSVDIRIKLDTVRVLSN